MNISYYMEKGTKVRGMISDKIKTKRKRQEKEMKRDQGEVSENSQKMQKVEEAFRVAFQLSFLPFSWLAKT